MEELWLESYNVDLPIRRITQTFQINDLADLKNRRLNFSNRFTLPMTPKNIQAMNFLGVTGSNSRKPYQKVKCRYVIDGVEIVVNGSALIKSSGSKGYSVTIYSGNNELYDEIKDKKISELDWSALNHTQTLADYEASWSNTSGYIYAIGHFSENDNTANYTANIERQLPSVFVHTIFDMILTQAGFTYSGEIFLNEKYLNEVIAPVRGAVLESGSYDVDFAEIMGDVTQVSFIKDVMQCFGMIFSTKARSSHYDFVTMEELYNDRETAEDWTMRLTDLGEESYSVGRYAKTNKLKYNYEDDVLAEDRVFDGEIVVDNENLNDDQTLFTSLYKISKRSFFKNNLPTYLIPLLEYDEDELVWNALEAEPRKFSIVRDDVSVSFKQGSSSTEYATEGVAFLSLEDISYNEYIANFYPALGRILNKQIKKTVKLYLSLVDIYTLDFFKLKYFSQFGQYYYLNKISNWKKGKETKVELIQVNNITENKAPNQLGDKEIALYFGNSRVIKLSDFVETSPPYNDPEFDDPETIKITSGFGNDYIKLFNDGVEITAETILDANDLKLTVVDQSLLYGAHSIEIEFTIQSENNPAFSSQTGKLLIDVPVKENRAPIADAGANQFLTYDNDTDFGFVIMDGSNSNDPDGDVLTYLWTLEGAPSGIVIQNPTGAITAVDANDLSEEDVFAQFVLRLRVTDPQGLYSEDTALVRIDSEHKAPIV